MGSANEGNTAALALEALHKQVLPFLLRRLKEDVLHDLPPKIIQDYYCELSEVQKYLYDNFTKGQEKQAEEAVKSENKEKQQHVFQSLQYLRKLCNHPALVLKEDGRAIQEALVKAGQSKSSQLNDIDHAPKLLALRCALLVWVRSCVYLCFGVSDNFFTTVVLGWPPASEWRQERANWWIRRSQLVGRFRNIVV